MPVAAPDHFRVLADPERTATPQKRIHSTRVAYLMQNETANPISELAAESVDAIHDVEIRID